MNQVWVGALLAGCSIAPVSAQTASGWGIDACITRHVTDAEFPAYVRLLSGSGIQIVRERDIGIRRPDGSYLRDVRSKFRALKAAGLTVTAFASLPDPVSISQVGDALPEDLRAVFAAGQTLQSDFAGLVDAWEMTGEPDVGFCRDLPERLVAYQKALYLGIKSVGEADSPCVLMGALALPPGPWLERAARNGLLNYTDAYNFHFYGHADDLAGVIRAHRKFVDRWTGSDLPFWITECGIKAVSSGDFLNADRRRLQADFTVATARQARTEGVAVFMPFILVERGDPYALTLSADRPLPAWTAYTAVIHNLPWPNRVLARAVSAANPVVLQWLPDNRTTAPHKVSGTYRFLSRQPIRGHVRIYNFGRKAVRGVMRTLTPAAVVSKIPRDRPLELAAGEMLELPEEFTPVQPGYFQAWWQAEFDGDDGSRSPLCFGLEPTPEPGDFFMTPLKLTLPAEEHPHDLIFADYRISSSIGAWTGINGVKVEAPSKNGAKFRVTELSGDPVGDPLYPPMAVARVEGLPAEGFLVVSPDQPLRAESAVRVDLIDNTGQRFTIWENFGQSYLSPRKELWLNLSDFHIYFWGHSSDAPRFVSGNIRELQLRFYCAHAGEVVGLNFLIARPR